jgi:hypothetical protein
MKRLGGTGKMDTKETFDDRIGQTPDKMTPNGSKSVSYPIGGMDPLHDNDTKRQPRPASVFSQYYYMVYTVSTSFASELKVMK